MQRDHWKGWPGRVARRSKYGNVPTRSKHTGLMKQSKHEAAHEPVLLALQNVGKIKNLRAQVPFRLEVYSTQAVDALLAVIDEMTLPAASTRPFDGGAWISAMEKAMTSLRRSRQLICKYIADYVYEEDGETKVDDPKGYRTEVYRIKKRLMVACHNIEIREPRQGGVQQWARGAGINGRGTGSRLKGNRARR